MLCNLGARLSKREPEVEAKPSKTLPLVGCSLDRSDAVTLARLVALRLLAPAEARASRAEPLPEVELQPQSLRLLWLPFAGDAYSLRESFTGRALSRRAVEELLAGSPAAGAANLVR